MIFKFYEQKYVEKVYILSNAFRVVIICAKAYLKLLTAFTYLLLNSC